MKVWRFVEPALEGSPYKHRLYISKSFTRFLIVYHLPHPQISPNLNKTNKLLPFVGGRVIFIYYTTNIIIDVEHHEQYLPHQLRLTQPTTLSSRRTRVYQTQPAAAAQTGTRG
jgi:hypothetical protein